MAAPAPVGEGRKTMFVRELNWVEVHILNKHFTSHGCMPCLFAVGGMKIYITHQTLLLFSYQVTPVSARFFLLPFKPA